MKLFHRAPSDARFPLLYFRSGLGWHPLSGFPRMVEMYSKT